MVSFYKILPETGFISFFYMPKAVYIKVNRFSHLFHNRFHSLFNNIGNFPSRILFTDAVS